MPQEDHRGGKPTRVESLPSSRLPWALPSSQPSSPAVPSLQIPPADFISATPTAVRAQPAFDSSPSPQTPSLPAVMEEDDEIQSFPDLSVSFSV